jgi:hypothetical protein
MKSQLTKYWAAVAMVWAVVVALSFWNTSQISIILKDIELNEIYRMDDLFWQFNSGKISKVLPQRDSMILPIESLKLGYLVIEDNLRALIEQHDFDEVLLEMSPSEFNGQGVPIRVYFRGPFERILPWLEALEKTFPYLAINQMKIFTDAVNQITRYQIDLFFRYRILTRADRNAALRHSPKPGAVAATDGSDPRGQA